MIPLMLKIQTRKDNGKRFNVNFPIIIIWIFLFVLFIVFSPFIIISAALAWPFGYGKLILTFPVMIYLLIASLKDLLIDIKNNREIVYISFY